MMSSRWIVLSGLMTAFMATGCTTISPPSTPSTQISWEQRSSKLSHLTSWKLNGKIAVQSAQQSGSASIDWVQNQRRYAISLLGPMGSNGMTLTGQPGRVTMQTADGKHAHASTPEQLLAQQWGWDLPVSNLNYWVRGLPVPSVAAETKFDNYHRMTSLSQQGWHVQYLGYTKANGMELPQRITITRAGFSAKLLIYGWNI